jgi:dipeptidyl-peptidase-4
MGIVNSQDQANAARAISKWPFVDSTRIGIWGWSGGGSSSLNAIFRYPDLYHMAMSVAPVPDIRYYDSIYQERYCGLPQDHPEEYNQSSPITFASQLNEGQGTTRHLFEMLTRFLDEKLPPGPRAE